MAGENHNMASVTPINIRETEEAIHCLNEALEAMQTASSFLSVEAVTQALPYTVYVELIKAVSNAGQGTKVILESLTQKLG